MSHPVGALVELEVGPVAHGGHVVARTPEGQVDHRAAIASDGTVVFVTAWSSSASGVSLAAPGGFRSDSFIILTS